MRSWPVRTRFIRRREEKAPDTFEKLALRYLVEHERKYARGPKKSPATVEAERVLKVDVLPTIGSYRAEAVTKRHVMDVVQKVADRGAFVATDRVLTIIRAVYNWAIFTGRLDVNPTLGLKKRNASSPRSRPR